MKTLMVGGPRDGDWVTVEHLRSIYRWFPVHRPLALATSLADDAGVRWQPIMEVKALYYLVRITQRHWVWVYESDDTNSENVLDTVIAGYKAKQGQT